MEVKDDHFWMQQALDLAQKAYELGEVPVGAIAVFDNELIGTGFNNPIHAHDPSAHAEIIALRAAGKALNNYRLNGVKLYVTLEPCSMCAGAMVHARIDQLIFATREPKAGVAYSQDAFFSSAFLNHRIDVKEGILQDEASQLLRNFFAERRTQQKN